VFFAAFVSVVVMWGKRCMVTRFITWQHCHFIMQRTGTMVTPWAVSGLSLHLLSRNGFFTYYRKWPMYSILCCLQIFCILTTVKTLIFATWLLEACSIVRYRYY